MANERLRSTIAARGLTLVDVATEVQVDPKTVERWVTADRLPHRKHRWQAAALLSADEAYLWPQAIDDRTAAAATQAEFVDLFTSRSAVPVDLWRSLLASATEGVDLLAYAALFLSDSNPDFCEQLASKAEGGVRVRILLGDPDSAAVHQRQDDEALGDGIAGRVRLSLGYLRPILGTEGVDVRLHGTTLYNSLYRFDETLLVNTHVFGAPAAHAPVLHLHRVPGGKLFDRYLASFERVWDSAKPLERAAAPGER